LRDIKFNSLDEVFVKAMAYELRIEEQNQKIGHANSSYQASCSQSSYATQHDTQVEVAYNFSAPHVNANNHDLFLNVSNNSSQINENSAKTYAPLEYKSDAWYAEIASIKADLAALKGQSEHKELIASAHECEKKNDLDLHSKSVLLKESSLVVEEHTYA
jgi:hypothetical protein